MEYNKKPFTFEEQAQRLLDRGLQTDKKSLVQCLKSVNYYRLSAYLYPYRKEDDNFKQNTTLDKVWKNYCFDRQLRLLAMDACERIEISVKTDVVYFLAHDKGAFAYLEEKNLSYLNKNEYESFIKRIKDETERAKREDFVKNFFAIYGDKHEYLPLWMLAEILSFGTTFTMFKGLRTEIKEQIATKYGVAPKVFSSWLHTISVVRNICAHHGRLYNRTLGVKPIIPRKGLLWKEREKIDNSKVFSLLTIFHYLIKTIAPQSKWKNKLLSLLQMEKDIPLSVIGFYSGWDKSDLWKDET